MMLRVRCQCGKVLKLTDYSVGKAIPCPKCGMRIRIAPRNHASIEALEEIQAPTPATSVEQDLYDFVPAEPPASRGAVFLAPTPPPLDDGPPCPFCQSPLPSTAKICIHCGVDLATGRPVHEVEQRVERITAAASWFLPVGVFPITATDPATRCGVLATWLIAAAMLLGSTAFYVYMRIEPDPDPILLNLQLWTGSRQAFEQKNARLVEMMQRRLAQQARDAHPKGLLAPQVEPEVRRRATTMAAAVAGAPEGVGFRPTQVLSYAFVHDTSRVVAFLYHLLGNLLFLLIFGLALNEILGSGKMLLVYAFLVLAAAGVHLLLNLRQPMHPTVGASAALSGLAGVYAVFFGWQHARLTAWLRLHTWFEHRARTIRGAWLVGAWFVYNDLLPALAEVRAEDAVIPHAVHGILFVLGLALALGMLVTRQVDLRGEDLVTQWFRRLRQAKRSPAT